MKKHIKLFGTAARRRKDRLRIFQPARWADWIHNTASDDYDKHRIINRFMVNEVILIKIKNQTTCTIVLNTSINLQFGYIKKTKVRTYLWISAKLSSGAGREFSALSKMYINEKS